mmetsp:Transcript_1773/g.3061  ORF Transcript_1773/g.3061 Transcript_1773/m.3061 type:complete len:371 (+) Transcript_1773:1477-2589(+)
MVKSAVGTWPFSQDGLQTAVNVLNAGQSALNAVVAGITKVELDPSVTSVGFGGLPNELGILQLDAAIMDGKSGNSGSVMAVERCHSAIMLARLVLTNCKHSVLVGQGARRFAYDQILVNPSLLRHMTRAEINELFAVDQEILEGLQKDPNLGFDSWPTIQVDSLNELEISQCLHLACTNEQVLTQHAKNRYQEYLEDTRKNQGIPSIRHPQAHSDTVGMICLDDQGNLVAGCATSGMQFKKVGRVGDSPMVGHGLYADGTVGAATASGDGDDMIRFCVSYTVVELMRNGMDVQQACEKCMERIMKQAPSTQAAVIAMDAKTGAIGAYATRQGFRFTCWTDSSSPVKLVDALISEEHQQVYNPMRWAHKCV